MPGSPLFALLLLLVLWPGIAPATSLAPGSLAAAARQAGIEVGAAVDANLSDERLATAAREFTSATMENSLKWTPLSSAPGVYDFTAADAAVDWATANGLRVRGHTLFWDRLNGTPSWLPGEIAAAPDPAARLTELMQAHAETVVGRYAGRIAQWDVVNEPLALGGRALDSASVYFQTLGESYLDIAFEAADRADPDALLFLNETLTDAPPVFEGLLDLLDGLLDRGVPIDGVGLQSHYVLVPPLATNLQSQIQQIADLGLLVELTELDIPVWHFASSPDPFAAQAQAYAEVFAACAAVVGCTGVTTWGIDDADTWLDEFDLTAPLAPNSPLLFDADLQPKPAYDAVVGTLTVPEPGTATLLLVASAMLGARRGRR